MNQKDRLIERLRKTGSKITRLRLAFIDYFCGEHRPTSVEELVTYLSLRGLKPNKTSIYRELEFLLYQNIVQEISFGDRKARYELKNTYHHHHLVCTVCKKVEDIPCPDNFNEETRKLTKEKGFEVKHHLLELFGVCKSCKN